MNIYIGHYTCHYTYLLPNLYHHVWYCIWHFAFFPGFTLFFTMTEDASRPTQPAVHHSSFRHPLKDGWGHYQSQTQHLRMAHLSLGLSASMIDVSDAEESLASSISPFLSTHHVSLGSRSTNICSCEDLWTWNL